MLCSRSVLVVTLITPDLMFRTRTVLAKTINRVTLVGVVRDMQSGALNDTSCLQFTLVTQDIDTSATVPPAGPSDSVVPLARRSTGCAKQQFCVRCTSPDEEVVNRLRLRLEEGSMVKCIGQLRLNSQVDGGKRRHFPYISISLADTTKGLLVLPPKRTRPGDV
jgi:hypothetical protein